MTSERTGGDMRQALENDRTAILVTGGAGFIGSNFIRYVLTATGFRGSIVNFDKLTYAGNLASLEDIDRTFGGKRYFFERGDICDSRRIEDVLRKYSVPIIVHFAAESHVDRSIHGPADFIETNINGTFRLLEAVRSAWKGRQDVRFHHVSTDEVYGSLGETGSFFENTPYDPRSPYSASKAASDHLVRAYFHTYGLPVTLSNCSNNYGPYHFPEKLIPLMILNALEGKGLPDIRRRQERARLALCGRPLRSGLADPEEGGGRRDLQYRRRVREAEHRGRQRDLRHSGRTCSGRGESRALKGPAGIRRLPRT